MYDPRFPGVLPTRPLPYPLIQQPMVLSPNAYGAWNPKDWHEDDLVGVVPVPRDRYVLCFALFGLTAQALRGKTDVRSLSVGASIGALAAIGLTVITNRT